MANKKINQLVLKTTIQSTDLFPLGDATTGQLYKKTIAELQAAIGGAVISVNGLVGTVVLDTDDIQELASPTNKYFTDARARAAISLTTTGSSGSSTYSSSTGVLNVPTYTLAGLGGITASFLSGGTGITYNSSTGVISYSGTVFTDASIRALVSAGTGLSYNSSTGVFSYSGTVYTDSSIRALISLTTNGSSGASTYNNTTGVLNVPTYTLAGLGGISLTSLSGSAPITYNSSTGAIGITQATTSTDGYLSSTDWNTFNGKQSALTLGNLTEATSSVLTITGGTGAIIGSGTSIQVKQASSTVSGFLSSTDWSTFNSKQGTITLTTTGTSGAATLSGGTLNIPQYQAALTNPVTGTGTSGYHAKWTSSSAIGNSLIYDTGTALGIGTDTPLNVTTNRTSVTINGTSTSILSFGTGGVGKAYIFNDGTNLETYSAGALIYNTAGNERMRITSAGNVGIGTSSPNKLLELAANSPVLRLTTTTQNTPSSIELGVLNAGNYGYAKIGVTNVQDYDTNLTFWTTPATSTTQVERMRITKDGNVGINTTSPGGKLQVSGGDRGTSIRVESSTNASVAMYNSTSGREYQSFSQANGDYSIYDETAGSYRFKIKSSGNVLIDTTTDNGEKLYVNGSIRATGSITANSDARLKKNIERIENALEKVGQISGYTYNTIYDEDRHAGVIAQEIDKVLPEIVNKGNDGLMGVEYGNISALLIEAIKEQKVLIESLQAKVEALSK